MGFDMYWRREVHRMGSIKEGDCPTTGDGKPLPPNNLGFSTHSVTGDTVGYLRKVNSVHAWIVDNLADGVDECQKIHLDRASMEALRDELDTAIATGEGMDPRSGFFFGSTEKDEYWKADLEDARRIVEWILQDMADEQPMGPEAWRDWREWYYEASW